MELEDYERQPDEQPSSESTQAPDGDVFEILTDEEYYARAEEHLNAGEIDFAQSALDCVREDGGKKHFIQSKIYKQKKWYNEQYKQLKAALKDDPDNEDYKKELDELNEFKKTGEYKKYKKEQRKKGMGDACGEGCAECCCAGSCECCAEGICEGLGGC